MMAVPPMLREAIGYFLVMAAASAYLTLYRLALGGLCAGVSGPDARGLTEQWRVPIAPPRQPEKQLRNVPIS